MRAVSGPADVAHVEELDIIHELSLTFEELSVAEEELRTQTEELANTQSALDTERRRYHELFQQAPVPYIVTDLAGVIQEANRAAGRLFRVEPRRLIGKPIVVFTMNASRRRLRDALSNVFADQETARVPLRLNPRNGPPARIEAMIAMSGDGPHPASELRWLLVDHTRRARRERSRKRRAAELEALVAQRTAELEQAQQLKDQLVATVSHEFRTALSAIGGYAELLEMGVRGPLNEAQLADVQRIRSAYDHLATIVDDLLSYSSLVAKQLPLDLAHTSLDDTLPSLVDLVLPQARTKDIRVEVAPHDQAVNVYADGERLRQIVLNLLGNAVKFTPRGGRVRLSWRAAPNDAFIDVRDSGPGIPADKRGALFQPFVRLPTNVATPGTGLGLTISRDLARAMAGDLTIEDVPGGGGCFVLRLPRSMGVAPK
jgi:PAS domain S-box-containing protein